MTTPKPHHRTASEARLATAPPPRFLKVNSPATCAELAELQMESPDSLVEKYHNAVKAQKQWAARPLAERQAILRKFRALVDENQDQLAKQVTVETGRPIAISNMVISIVPARIAFWIDRAEAAFAVDKPAALMPGMNLEVHWEPLGVLAHISAWNFPILMGCDFLVPALVCGNAVMYKPSEYSVLSGQMLCKLLYDAGVPPALCPCLVGDGVTGEQLLDLPIDAVSFIGSVDTGNKIASKVGPKLIKMDLEMGGKDGFAVLEDADIDQAVAVLAEAAMENTGQSCNRADRIFVADSIYDKFLEGFVAAIKAMPEGDPLDPKTKIGAITRPQHIAYLEEQVKDAVNKGATVVLGGGRDTSRQGSFFHPTVLTNVDHSMRILTHENFGPIIGVQRLPPKCSDDEVVRLINDTAFGLTGGVFTKNRERAASIMGRLQTGSAYWNVTGLVEPAVPWSGRKCSGFGYTMSSDLRHQNLKPRSLYFPSQ